MIVITGASDGLGLEVAKLYQKAGKTVVNISRTESEAADINICLSLRKGPEIEEAARQVLAITEPLEALIHCAGVPSKKPFKDITEDDIKLLMSTNVKPQILLTAQLMDRIEKDETDMVHVASTMGFKGYKDGAVFGVTKWALRGLVTNLQVEFKDKPNRVISFCPGGMRTKLYKKNLGFDPTTEGDWMDPADVAIALKQTLDLPKNMEVSEIIINRK